MTPEMFLGVQAQLASAFHWFVIWWLIGLLVAGVGSIVIVFTLIMTRDMISKL